MQYPAYCPPENFDYLAVPEDSPPPEDDWEPVVDKFGRVITYRQYKKGLLYCE